jgi:glycyl-tRNA synthetase beta chain
VPKDLLLEIGTEEMPAKFLPDIVAQLEKLAAAELSRLLISFANIKAYATPRRMAVLACSLPEAQAEAFAEFKGPPLKIAYNGDGSWSKAAIGFARGQAADPGALFAKDGYLYVRKHYGGQPVEGLLPQALLNVINALSFPKSMRWSDLDFRFVRPVHWLLALWGDKALSIEAAGVKSGKTSRGHRFLSDRPVKIDSPARYLETLKEHFVMADQEARRAAIKGQIEGIAGRLGGKAAIDGELLEEVVYLVEYPTALSGRMDEKFLALPQEAVITPMREHQRYFPVFGGDGRLLPYFITVRNGDGQGLCGIAAGNERVLRARLGDAAFFFNEDKKHTLASRTEKLKRVVFREGLGSMYDKAQRIDSLAAFAAVEANLRLNADEREMLSRTAQLCKADLTSGMVCEFTELQGVMGREYALLDGEAALVAEGIFEHYLPRFAGDRLPLSFTGRLTGIADKLDNITAAFGSGLAPTGSQDPYALRRQAIGVVNIIRAAGWNVPLSGLVRESARLLGATGEGLAGQILEFFGMRVRSILAEDGLRHDLADAVLAADSDDIARIFKRAAAVGEFAAGGRLADAVRAFTRVSNIAKQPPAGAVDEGLLAEPAEKELFAVLAGLREEARAAGAEDYGLALELVARLAPAVDKFFAEVMVMAPEENLKDNRLRLLGEAKKFALGVADFSRIVSDGRKE